MPGKILLVDDDVMSQWALDEALTDAGFEVLQAATGEWAGKLIAEVSDIDVLVTDIALSGPVSGLQLARFWRARRDRPTVFITGFSSQDAGIMSLDRRDAFLQKPFAAAALIETVSRLIDVQESGRLTMRKRASWREPRAG